jgi:Domain of Unknown Function (DUF1080)
MPRRLFAAVSLCILAALLIPAATHAQTAPPAKLPPPPSPFPLTGPAPPNVPPTPLNDSNDGFHPIFNGTSLDGWDGDTRYWRAENGELIGEVTPANLLRQNNFIIWRGGTPANFELKAEFKLTGGNSGINYRSEEIAGTKYLLRGYQADIDARDVYTGQNYEERRRTFLAPRGTITYAATGQKPAIIANIASSDELKAFIKNGDWNQYHLIIRGNVLIHILNGHVMSEVIDDDTANRRMDGLIGVQVHVGGPMKVEFRNFLLKELP